MTYCSEFSKTFPCFVSNDPKFTLRENKSSVSALNSSRDQIFLFKPDEFITTKKACDYLLLNCEKINCWYIELKGNNLDHAYRQITQTIQYTWQLLTESHKVNAVIVLTKVSTPNYNNTPSYLKFKKELDKRFKNKNTVVVISRTTQIQLS